MLALSVVLNEGMLQLVQLEYVYVLVFEFLGDVGNLLVEMSGVIERSDGVFELPLSLSSSLFTPALPPKRFVLEVGTSEGIGRSGLLSLAMTIHRLTSLVIARF
jgi:hypothetical protein